MFCWSDVSVTVKLQWLQTKTVTSASHVGTVIAGMERGESLFLQQPALLFPYVKSVSDGGLFDQLHGSHWPQKIVTGSVEITNKMQPCN